MNKLFELKKKIGKISKDKTNPFYESKYFDINGALDNTNPLFEEFGILVTQPLTNINGRPAIKTIFQDAEDDKVLLKGTITMPDLQDPQKMGSCITYYRRYALQSALGLQAEDDDGNKGAGKVKTPVKKTVDPLLIKKTKLLKLVKKLKSDIKNEEVKEFIETTTKEKLNDKNLDSIIGKLELSIEQNKSTKEINK